MGQGIGGIVVSYQLKVDNRDDSPQVTLIAQGIRVELLG